MIDFESDDDYHFSTGGSLSSGVPEDGCGNVAKIKNLPKEFPSNRQSISDSLGCWSSRSQNDISFITYNQLIMDLKPSVRPFEASIKRETNDATPTPLNNRRISPKIAWETTWTLTRCTLVSIQTNMRYDTIEWINSSLYILSWMQLDTWVFVFNFFASTFIITGGKKSCSGSGGRCVR